MTCKNTDISTRTHIYRNMYVHIHEYSHTCILTCMNHEIQVPTVSSITSGSIECQQWENTETSHSLIYRGIALAAMWAFPGTRLHGLGALLRAGVNVKARAECTHLLCEDVVRVGERANPWLFQRNNSQSFFNFRCL